MKRENVLEHFKSQEDLINKKLESAIENHRKGICTLKITDKSGKELAGLKIKCVQKSHEFKYGANIFMLDELETEEKNKLYKKYFSEAFNIATLPFYWKDLEPTEDYPRFFKDSPKIYRRPPIDLCIEYCKENGIEPREHCLNYDPWNPDWLKDKSVFEIKEKLEKRIKILAERYSDVIPCWEVTNETLYTKMNEEASAFYHEPDFVEWSFDTSEKYLKNNKLVINDAHCNVWVDAFNFNRSAYYMQIERALRSGCKIDVIGMQFHMFCKKEDEMSDSKRYYNPKHLYDVMNTYAEFKKPLQITEITIPAYSNGEEDEKIQAEIIKYLYKIWFSQPEVEQIIYWNLVDGYAAFAPQGDMTAGENYYYGGLIRFDLTPKPSYYAIKDLFQNVWHTNENVITDNSGNASFKGFYGKYILEFENNGESICREIDFTKKNTIFSVKL